MSKDDIIEMAKQAGMVQDGDVWFSANNYEQSDVHTAELEAFAKLVAAKEREAINSLAEKELLNTSALMSMPPQSSAAWNILQAIRARGEA